MLPQPASMFSNYASGLYFIKIQAGKTATTKKLLVR